MPELGTAVPAASAQQAGVLPGALARTGATGLALLGLMGAAAAAAGTALQVGRRRLAAAE